MEWLKYGDDIIASYFVTLVRNTDGESRSVGEELGENQLMIVNQERRRDLAIRTTKQGRETLHVRRIWNGNVKVANGGRRLQIERYVRFPQRRVAVVKERVLALATGRRQIPIIAEELQIRLEEITQRAGCIVVPQNG